MRSLLKRATLTSPGAGLDKSDAAGTYPSFDVDNVGHALSLITTSDTRNSGNFEQTSGTAVALRLRQSGTGPIGKWKRGSADVGFIDNDGSIRLTPPSNGRGFITDGAVWAAGRPFGYANKDGLNFVSGWVDNSGLPILSGIQQSYSKGWGLTASKNGPGNMDVFWASVSHNGPDEVGLLIGDMTSHAGGNSWGFDVRAQNDTTDSTLIGGYIGVQRNAAPGTGVSTTLAADGAVGDMTIACAIPPGLGRFTVDTGAHQEWVSVLSVAGSVATLSTPLVWAHTAGAAVTPVSTSQLGLRIRSHGAYDNTAGLIIDSAPGVAGGWSDYIRVVNPAGTLLFYVGAAGLTKTGALQPYDNGNRDLGLVGSRWRNAYLNNLSLNGADFSGASGAMAVADVVAAPTRSPSPSGTVFYSVGGVFTTWGGFATALRTDTGATVAQGTITARTNADAAQIFRLETDRPWAFRQVGTAGSTALRLSPDGSDKVFRITAPTSNRVLEVTVSDTAANQTMKILPDSGSLSFFGATPVVKQTLPASGVVTAADIRTLLINYGLAA